MGYVHSTMEYYFTKERKRILTCDNMAGPWEHFLSEINQTQRDRHRVIALTRSVWMRQIPGDRKQNRSYQGLAQGAGELLFNGYKVSVGDDRKVLEIDHGDGYLTLWMYVITLNCALQMVKMVNCTSVHLTIDKKNTGMVRVESQIFLIGLYSSPPFLFRSLPGKPPQGGDPFLGRATFVTVLVCSSCHNEIAQAGGPKQ